MGYTESELSVLIVDDERMAELNRKYRSISRTTDVLSFPMLEGEFGQITPQMLGDVVISAQTAKVIGEQTGAAFKSIMDLLLVHGILHLIGLDHEGGQAEAREVKLKTEELLVMLGHRGNEFEWFFDKE